MATSQLLALRLQANGLRQTFPGGLVRVIVVVPGVVLSPLLDLYRDHRDVIDEHERAQLVVENARIYSVGLSFAWWWLWSARKSCAHWEFQIGKFSG